MRVLAGIWALQAATAALTVLALHGQAPGLWPLTAALGLGAGALAAMWLGARAGADRRLAEERLRRRHAEDRETLTRESARQQARAAARLSAAEAQARAGRAGRLKAGAMAGAAAGIGATLLLVQLFALGLAMLAFAAGATAGYTLRGRLARRRRPEAAAGAVAAPDAELRRIGARP